MCVLLSFEKIWKEKDWLLYRVLENALKRKKLSISKTDINDEKKNKTNVSLFPLFEFDIFFLYSSFILQSWKLEITRFGKNRVHIFNERYEY